MNNMNLFSKSKQTGCSIKKRIFRKLLLLFIFNTSFLNLWAQSNPIVVNGTVIDQTGQPLIGVTVQTVDGKAATITDLSGKFSINSNINKPILKFSSVGFLPQTVKITSSPYTVTMLEDNKLLDEVVIVSYGTQRKKDLTGAISVVNTETLKKQTTPDIGIALQGLATGVHVTSSGEPGTIAEINIRGIGSLSNVSPLYVIDGVIMQGSHENLIQMI